MRILLVLFFVSNDVHVVCGIKQFVGFPGRLTNLFLASRRLLRLKQNDTSSLIFYRPREDLSFSPVSFLECNSGMFPLFQLTEPPGQFTIAG